MPDHHFAARFEAYTEPVDFMQTFHNPLFDLALLHQGATSIVRSPSEITVTGYDFTGEYVTLDLFSAPHHPFTYNSHGFVTGGTITRIADDWGLPPFSSPYFSICGLHTPVLALRTDVVEMFHNADKSLLDTWHLLLPGNDLIKGSTGNDVLVGSNGPNTFGYSDTAFGQDIIINFTVGVDKIGIKTTIFNNFLDVKDHSTFVNHHLVIEFDPSDTITVNSIHNPHQLHPYEFHFFP
jgi:hypothetical protein